jgi:hypothetical protein
MNDRSISTLVHVTSSHGDGWWVKEFLRRYPDVAAAIQSAGAYVVVFAPALQPEDFDESPAPGVFLERVRRALDEAEHTLPPRQEWPLYVCDPRGLGFPAAIWERDNGNEPIAAIRPGRGVFAGFVFVGDAGAFYVTPGGRDALDWDRACELVLEELPGLVDRTRSG